MKPSRSRSQSRKSSTRSQKMNRIPRLLATTEIPKQARTEVVFISKDAEGNVIAGDDAYTEVVERLVEVGSLTGKAGEVATLRLAGRTEGRHLLLLGMGSASEQTEEKIRSLGGLAWSETQVAKLGELSVIAGSLGASMGRLLKPFAEGLALATYRFRAFKSEAANGGAGSTTAEESLRQVSFVCWEEAHRREVQADLDAVTSMAECVQLARDWSNLPSNVGTPEFYAAEARRMAAQEGLKCRVLDEAQASREKMGLFLAVGAGSDRESRVVILEYTPRGVKNPRTLSFVGKGVTFDAGGISIKPALRMEEMKHDMSGAANVFAATLLAARMKARCRIVTVIVLTENMPSGTATQPGNIIEARNGKRVEIINTDAEGRLILADALDLAQDYKPDAVIDIATLTGAVSIALGKQAAAILGNDDPLIEAVCKAAQASGERLWQLPLWDEYLDDMRSDSADLKNSCNDSHGGTIRGAMFLKQFVRKGVPWAHLDIAAMANGVTHLSYVPKRGATGLYVRTLARVAMEF